MFKILSTDTTVIQKATDDLERTSLTTMEFCDICRSTPLPAGTLNQSNPYCVLYADETNPKRTILIKWYNDMWLTINGEDIIDGENLINSVGLCYAYATHRGQDLSIADISRMSGITFYPKSWQAYWRQMQRVFGKYIHRHNTESPQTFQLIDWEK